MEEPFGHSFVCPTCQRRFKWQSSIAGHSAKCSCGATLRVPQAPHADTPELDSYDLALSAGPPAQAPRPIPAIAIARPVQTLDYQDSAEERKARRFAAAMTDPTRDLYLPIALYVAGFLLLLAWLVFNKHSSALGIAFVSLAVAVLVIIKTGVLTGLAFLIAPRFDVGFGTLRSAVLKFAAIVIFVDAAGQWLLVFMRSAGAVSGKGGGGLIELLFTAALILCALHYLFDIDGQEARWIVRFMILALFLVDVGALVALRAATTTLQASRRPPTPVAAVSSANPASPATPTPPPAAPAPVLTDAERQVADRISRHSPTLVDGREWTRNMRYASTQRATSKLIEDLYAAGAPNVYVDMAVAITAPQTGPRAVSLKHKLYAELPADPAQRAACIAAAANYLAQKGLPPPPQTNNTKFLILDP